MREHHGGISALLAFVLVLPLAIGCGKPGAAISDSTDATITTRVKTAILKDPVLGALRIDVDTVRGVVTLSGQVDTAAQRDQAIAIARSVGGVVDVKDALKVAPRRNERRLLIGMPAGEAS
jgi:hyperosmotically inducible protein